MANLFRTPSGSFISAWTAYTPTFTGFGTASAVDFWWRRVGGNLEVFGTFTMGTNTAVEAKISFPSGVPNSAAFADRTVAGVYILNAALAGALYVIVVPSVAYFNVSIQNATGAGSGPLNGNAFTNGLTYAIEKFKDHPIAGHITLIKGERSELATISAKIL